MLLSTPLFLYAHSKMTHHIAQSVTTEYALKRCQSIAYVRSFNDIPSVAPANDDGDNVLIIDDTCNLSNDYSSIFPNGYAITDDIRDITRKLKKDANNYIYINLAHKQTKTIKVPVEEDNLKEHMITLVGNYLSMHKDISRDVSDKLLKKMTKFINNSEYFSTKKLSPYVKDVLRYIFEHIIDSNMQELIIYLLKHNDEDVEELETQVNYKEEDIFVYPHTSPFEDIRIAVDKDNKNKSTKSFNRKAADLQNSSKLNNLIQLQAFSANMFVVIHGKKNCDIKNVSHLQNHDVINSIYRNGVMNTPLPTREAPELSFDILINELHQLKSFNICFIHPNLEIRGSKADTPCDDVQPSYGIGNGEILAVSYRYITVNFFPYCAVHADDMDAYGYII